MGTRIRSEAALTGLVELVAAALAATAARAGTAPLPGLPERRRRAGAPPGHRRHADRRPSAPALGARRRPPVAAA